MNLLETILNAKNGDMVRQIADNFQLDEAKTKSVMGALVPALSRGLGKNASDSQGLDNLVGALTSGNHSKYIEEPGAVTEPSSVDEGNKILGHILGSKDVSRQLASSAAQSSGVDSGIIKQMLPMLASMAMGAMAKNGAGNSSGVTDLLTGFLDADKDGSAIDDIMGMASRFLR